MPVLFLISLFVSLGAVLCLLWLLGVQRNINVFAHLLKLGNLGEGSFQFVEIMSEKEKDVEAIKALASFQFYIRVDIVVLL